MAEWFNFALYALQQIVSMVFNLDLGIGFSLGDFEIALLLIGVIATALVVKIGSAASNEVMGAKNYTERLDREWNKKAHPALRGHRRDINPNF